MLKYNRGFICRQMAMIVVKVMGGLGNQIFQYAMGRQLALRRKEKAYLDVSLFDESTPTTHTLRPYELGVFQHLLLEPLPAAEKHQLLNTLKLPYRLYNKGRQLLGLSPSFLYMGEGEYFAANQQVLAGGPPAKLLQVEGHWQNEIYFADVATQLRRELVFIPFTDDRNIAVATKLKDSPQPTVSVHVRRGDYAQYPAFGMCSVDYYARALAYMQQHLTKPAFFVFSDDIAWVRENLPLPADTTFIDWNRGTDNYCDMHLMSLCQNQIIANSSFSWWGAWLNANPTKIVICPAIWMAQPVVPAERVVPATWIRL